MPSLLTEAEQKRRILSAAESGRALSVAEWSALVHRWNARKAYERTQIAAQCRDLGHDRVRSPVGPMCRRCFAYF